MSTEPLQGEEKEQITIDDLNDIIPDSDEDNTPRGKCQGCKIEDDVASLTLHIPGMGVQSVEGPGIEAVSEDTIKLQYCRDCLPRTHFPGFNMTQKYDQKEIEHDAGGRPPKGFHKADGELFKSFEFDEIQSVLQQVVDGETSKNAAANKLGWSWATVDEAIRKPDLYELH